MTLNIWDFGGQEIMHGTHRFFLTERSLYLLVLEDRREDDRSIYDWLKVIRNRGGNSPVMVVINKCDDGADPTCASTRPGSARNIRRSSASSAPPAIPVRRPRPALPGCAS